jgi:hypothetical protein
MVNRGNYSTRQKIQNITKKVWKVKQSNKVQNVSAANVGRIWIQKGRETFDFYPLHALGSDTDIAYTTDEKLPTEEHFTESYSGRFTLVARIVGKETSVLIKSLPQFRDSMNPNIAADWEIQPRSESEVSNSTSR